MILTSSQVYEPLIGGLEKVLVFCFVKNKAKGLSFLSLRMHHGQMEKVWRWGLVLDSALLREKVSSFLPVSQQLNGDSDSCCPEL